MSNTRGCVNWDSSEAPNPSTHAAYATAELKRYVYYPLPAHWEYMSISSRSAPSTGDGWDAEFAIADIMLKSLEYTGGLCLKQNLDVSVPTPQVTWNRQGRRLATSRQRTCATRSRPSSSTRMPTARHPSG